MKHRAYFFLLVCFLLSCHEPSGKKWFELHTVSTDLPEEAFRRFGTPALADFDNDGDLDFSLSVTKGEIYLFEKQDSAFWRKHTIGEIPTGQLAGAAFDVDKDGWMDIIGGGHWFRNSQDPAFRPFTRYDFDTTIHKEMHDMVLEDVDGDGRKDLVSMGDKEGCYWYRIPENPMENVTWKRTTITLEVLDDRADIHGGLFPGGVGDLDNDGDVDIVMPGRWYANENSGQNWERRFLPFGSSGYWGLSSRSWIVDLDLDGDQDIVIVSCDQVDSRGAWLENNGKPNPGFKVHLLPLSANGRRGSFHSLWMGDFDMDGDNDIFTMEQEDSSILPQGATSRAFIWENIDGKGQEFVERVVLDENIGGHDVKFADADGDGDLDAYFKVWKGLPSNAYGGKPHVNFLENLSVD